MSRRSCLAWAHEHAGIMGATARPYAPPGAAAQPLGARPGRRRADTRPDTGFGADTDLLEAAAWLHDIGSAPGRGTTGLHQFDGAWHPRDAQHTDAMLYRLVAHHSCAISEVGERELADVLRYEFDPAPDVLASVLTCCDMTTSPDGEPVPAEQRLAEVHDRYGPGHLVSRSIQRATPMILRAVEQVHHRAAQTT
jgi:hypothetical protein